MAHFAKTTRAGAHGLLDHCEREKKKNTKNIDEERSGENMYIVPDESGQNVRYLENPAEMSQRYEDRLHEVHVWNRSDVKTLCSWVITLPDGVTKGEERQFFEEAVKFCAERYGAENIVGGAVHYDEQGKKSDGTVRPHVHVLFIPVVRDKKKGFEKVSNKERITKLDLQQFHPDLEARMKQVFGREIGILNGITQERGGNVTLSRYKLDRQTEKTNKLDEFLRKKEKQLEEDRDKVDQDRADNCISKYFFDIEKRAFELAKDKLKERENRVAEREKQVEAREQEVEAKDQRVISSMHEQYRKLFEREKNINAEVEQRVVDERERLQKAQEAALKAQKEAEDAKDGATFEKNRYASLNEVLEERGAVQMVNDEQAALNDEIGVEIVNAAKYEKGQIVYELSNHAFDLFDRRVQLDENKAEEIEKARQRLRKRVKGRQKDDGLQR